MPDHLVERYGKIITEEGGKEGGGACWGEQWNMARQRLESFFCAGQ